MTNSEFSPGFLGIVVLRLLLEHGLCKTGYLHFAMMLGDGSK